MTFASCRGALLGSGERENAIHLFCELLNVLMCLLPGFVRLLCIPQSLSHLT